MAWYKRECWEDITPNREGWSDSTDYSSEWRQKKTFLWGLFSTWGIYHRTCKEIPSDNKGIGFKNR
jgi:hypothetical protein